MVVWELVKSVGCKGKGKKNEIQFTLKLRANNIYLIIKQIEETTASSRRSGLGQITMKKQLNQNYFMLYRVLIMIYRSSSAMSVQKIAVQRL